MVLMLLAGHSAGEFDTKPGLSSSLSDWITTVHPCDHDHLVNFLQASGGTDLVLSNTNHSITLQKFPEPRTESSVHATFRLVSNGSTSARSSETRNASGQLVMLEPYDLPGMFITHNDKDNSLIISDGSSTFRIVLGLDGKNGTVPIELLDLKGFYVFSDLGTAKLGCGSDGSSSSFGQGASFVLNKGLSEYHPISFVAKGEK